MNIKTSIIKKPIIGALFFASSIIAPIVYAATPFIPQPIIQLPIIPPPIITIPSAPVVPPVAPNPPIDHDKFLQFAESNRSDTVDSFNNAGSLLAKGSATAYYEAIDPLNQKTTINDWKTLNGFIEPLPSTAAGLASMGITHAVYRNATDLGFVRNIYMRVKPNGDVVALLENFASFDRTLKRSTDEVNDSCTTAFNGTLPEAQQCTSGGIAAYESRDLSGMLAAVVMEYSAGTTGGAKFTQFYGYVNKVNGVTDVNNASRVAALDLTGRGKAEAFPGLCATCHGGTPGGIDANGKFLPPDRTYDNAANGNFGAGFLPWDPDLYEYHDPNNAGVKLGSGVYSRANQEANFKALNTMALLTNPTRAARELIEGWYGGTALPNAFNGHFVPSGWTDTPQDTAFYQAVIAPYCRACHIQRAHPESNTNPNLRTPYSFGVFTSEGFDSQMDFNSSLDLEGLYKQFGKTVFERTTMPMALVTYNKFWKDSVAVQEFVDYVNQWNTFVPVKLDATGVPLLDALGKQTGIRPGKPIAIPGTYVDQFVNQPLTLDGSQSLFVNNAINAYAWSVIPQIGQPAANFTLSNANTATPTFTASVAGIYTLSLTVNYSKFLGLSIETDVSLPVSTQIQVIASPFAKVTYESAIQHSPDNARCVLCHKSPDAAGYESFDTYREVGQMAQLKRYASIQGNFTPRLLYKPTGALADTGVKDGVHKGGKILRQSDVYYSLLKTWINDGACESETVGCQRLSVTNENTALQIDPLSIFLDKTLAVSLTPASPAHGVLALESSGKLRYTPASGYTGEDTYQYRLTQASTGLSQVITENIFIFPDFGLIPEDLTKTFARQYPLITAPALTLSYPFKFERINTDSDVLPNYLDDFPNDAFVSRDTDGDGSPDAFNNNVTPTGFQALIWHLFTGLSLDDDDDNDGVLDAQDDLPLLSIASIDTDGDGFPDSFHTGVTSAQITASGVHLDAFPTDPAASLDTDNDGAPDSFNAKTTLAQIAASALLVDAAPLNSAISLALLQETTAQITSSGEINVVLKSDGTLWAWGGNNFSGGLGNGSNITQPNPAPVVDATGTAFSGIQSIAAKGAHSLALKNDGTLLSWGSNTTGQLGDNSLVNRFNPVVVVDSKNIPITEIQAIAAGSDTFLVSKRYSAAHSLALKKDGSMLAWGANFSGQLGDGTTFDRLTPVAVTNSSGVPINGIQAIAAGGNHTVALKNNGTLLAWGDNSSGQLGIGSTANKAHPVPVVISIGVGINIAVSNIQAIVAGSGHTVALKNDGTLLAWGDNASGQLGDGTTVNKLNPVSVVDSLGVPISGIQAIAAGGHDTFALKTDGTVLAWGDNYQGRLGDGTTINQLTPVVVVDALGNAINGIQAIAAGLAMKADGSLLQWGGNFSPEKVIDSAGSFLFLLLDQSISFTPASTATVGDSIALSATSTSGLTAFSFGTSTPNICTVSGTGVTYNAAGTCALTADQTGNATYAVAPQVSANITVTAANTFPIATNVSIQVPLNGSAQGHLIGSDANGDPLTFSMIQNGTLGNIVIVDTTTGLFDYTPQSGITGTDTMTFQVDDGNGGTATATLTVTIVSSSNKIDVFNLGDVNGDTLDDIAVVEVNSAGVKTIFVKSAIDGVAINTLTFNSAFNIVDEVVLPDMNGNGAAEVVVLGDKIIGNAVIAQVIDALTGNIINNVVLNTSGWKPSLITTMNDMDGNGVSELLVLGTSGSGQVQVALKDAQTGNAVGAGVINYGKNFSGLVAFEMIPDLNASGFPEVAVLGVDANTGRTRIQIRDTGTGLVVAPNVTYPAAWTIQRMKVIPDINADGRADMAVLATKPTAADKIAVQTRDAFNGTPLSVVQYGNTCAFTDFQVVPDTNGNGFAELAVLAKHKSNGKVIVSLKDSNTGTVSQNLFFNANFSPTSLVVLNDLDGDLLPEMGVLGTNLALITSTVQIQSTATGVTVNTVAVP